MVKKQVLGEQIKEAIMNDIFEGRLKPEERLVESALAKKYGVSQAPVREALKILQSLHLVETKPYTGTVVRQFTKKDMEEFFVVRSALEGLAGRLAAVNCTDDDIDELQHILDEMFQAVKDNDHERRIELNSLFHAKLIRTSKNRLLIETSENLRLHSWSRVTGGHTRMSPKRLAERHQIFIDLLKARDAEGMEQAMIKHTRQSLDYFTMDTFPHNKEE